MTFMDSPRGKLLTFLWKKRNKALPDLELEEFISRIAGRNDFDRAKGLVGASELTAKDFLDTLSVLRSEGLVKDDAMTDAGEDIFTIEYKTYQSSRSLIDSKKAKESEQVIAEVDAIHDKDIELRKT